MIQCTGIEKSYTDKKVLSGISFDIPDGQIFGLLGPSGAGKTTLIKILTGQKINVNNIKEEIIIKSPNPTSKKYNLYTENYSEIQKNMKNLNPLLWLIRNNKKEGKRNLDNIEDLITSLTVTTKPNSSDEKISTKLIPIQLPLPNIISPNLIELKNNLIKKGNDDIEDDTINQNLYFHKNWKKGDIIHNGENSTIYKAFNISIGNIFIIKEYKINDNSINKKNYFQEVKLLKLLRHSNIVNFLGAEVFKNKHYVYLDYVSGDNVKDFISKFGGIKENMIKKYIKQIISVFEFIYSQGYFYGNLSLNHILIDSDGLIKITDFSKVKSQRNFQKNNFFNLTTNSDIQSIGNTFKELIQECEKSFNEISYSNDLKEYLDFISNDRNLITFHALKNHPFLK